MRLGFGWFARLAVGALLATGAVDAEPAPGIAPQRVYLPPHGVALVLGDPFGLLGFSHLGQRVLPRPPDCGNQFG